MFLFVKYMCVYVSGVCIYVCEEFDSKMTALFKVVQKSIIAKKNTSNKHYKT